MKILMVNKFFYKKGGSETYYFELKKLLEQNGHKVIDFSMKDKKNFESKYSDFFIDNIDYDDQKTILQKVILGFKIIYSYESKNKLEKLIKEEKPDIVVNFAAENFYVKLWDFRISQKWGQNDQKHDKG